MLRFSIFSPCLTLSLPGSVPAGRLSADDGKDELSAESGGIRQRCSHHLPGHNPHLPLPAGEEVILCKTLPKPKLSSIIMYITQQHNTIFPGLFICTKK